MATWQFYNTTPQGILDQSIHLDSLKLMLLNNTASFNATHTTLNQVAGSGHTKEVAGNGWTVGGEDVTPDYETYDTNSARIIFDQISVLAAGGDIGPAYAYVIYDDADTDDRPLGYCDFGGARTANDGTPFNVDSPSAGMFYIEPAA